jgi:hypothetical protein
VKEDVILRILAQESPDSKLQLKRYGRKKLWRPNLDFGRLYGLLWKIPVALVHWIQNLEQG